MLPGTDTTDKSVVLIEGHMDSRCENNFDGNCLAEGIEDNATGTALVMELARVMSKYSFKNSIVFLVTIGEEQGLYGAAAFATYCQNKGIKLKGVQNNDVIGGIYCGNTASAPTDCKQSGDVDSLNVRIFSYGDYTSPHKAYARFSKLQYLDEVKMLENIPMDIKIMTPEDRTGRGGDHIPFRQKNYTSVRFTASHEHGNASSTTPGYTDRQHSFRDTLGVDKDSDGIIDSFYISFSYLRRNTLINGAAAAMAAMGPVMPTFNATVDSGGIVINVLTQTQYGKYRLSVRRNSANYDLDLLYNFNGTSFRIPGTKKDSIYYISLASQDSNDVESVFTIEKKIINSVVTYIKENLPEQNLYIYPNPGRGLINIENLNFRDAEKIQIRDLGGRVVLEKMIKADESGIQLDIPLQAGIYYISLSNMQRVSKAEKLIILN